MLKQFTPVVVRETNEKGRVWRYLDDLNIIVEFAHECKLFTLEELYFPRRQQNQE
jgi:hypothetical protein